MSGIKKALSKFKVNRYFILLFLICIAAGYFKDVALLFMFALIHELCHVVSAILLKIKIRNIELFPFGGVARIDNLDYMGTYREIIINIAGPLFNAATAIFLLLIKGFRVSTLYLNQAVSINIMLAVFNMLPGLPLDGGRILRAALNCFIGFKKATRVAIISGRVIASVLMLCGVLLLIYGRFNIGFFAVPFFMLYASRQEESIMTFMVMKDIIGKKKKLINNGFMEAKFICAYEDMYMEDVIKHIDLDKYHIIIIIGSDMKIKGTLTESQVLDGISGENSEITLGQFVDNME